MSLAFWFAAILSVFAYPYGTWMLFRNNVVYDYWIFIADRCLASHDWSEYDALPNYQAMVFQFWKYPIRKLKEEMKCQRGK